MHRPDGFQILVNDRIGGAPALGDIALQAADEPQVGIGIYKDLDVEQLAQGFLGEDQDAVHDDHPLRLHPDGFAGARMGGEVVNRDFYRLQVLEPDNVLDEQVRLQ